MVLEAAAAVVGRLSHDADQGAALGPVGLNKALDEPLACVSLGALEAEKAATDGGVGEDAITPCTSASVEGGSRSVVPSRRMTSTKGSAGWARSTISVA